MQISKPKNRLTPKKIIITLIIVVVLAALGYGVYAYTNDAWPFQKTDDASHLESSTLEDNHGNKIDDQPATDENQQQVNDKKEQDRKRIEQNEQNEKNRVGKKKVDVVITTFDQDQRGVNVNGFATGVIENDGICTLTLTDEKGKTVSTTRKSHENAKNTTCGESTIPLSKLHSGKWTITLSYDSPTATGESQANIAPTIEVK